VDVRFGDLLDRRTFIDPGAVDADVEPPECRVGLRKEPFDIGGLRDVASNGDRSASTALDLGDHPIGTFLARRVVHNHGGAGLCQMLGDDAPIPFDAPVTMATSPSSRPLTLLMWHVLLGAATH